MRLNSLRTWREMLLTWIYPRLKAAVIATVSCTLPRFSLCEHSSSFGKNSGRASRRIKVNLSWKKACAGRFARWLAIPDAKPPANDREAPEIPFSAQCSCHPNPTQRRPALFLEEDVQSVAQQSIGGNLGPGLPQPAISLSFLPPRNMFLGGVSRL
jgi:hypothetical protein